MPKTTWEENGCLFYASLSLLITEGNQSRHSNGRNQATGVRVEAMEKGCLLDWPS